MKKSIIVLLYLTILSIPLYANEPSNISLTASDGSGLELRKFDARIVIDDFLAFTELEMVFYNPQARRLQGSFQIVLPDGAAVSRFAMKIGEYWQEGEIVEKQLARQAYEDFLHLRQDPALLEGDSGNRFNARIFPIEPKSEKTVIISYSQRLEGHQSDYVLPLQGLPILQQLSIRVFFTNDIEAKQTEMGGFKGILSKPNILVITQQNHKPMEDFRIPYKENLPKEQGPGGVVLQSGKLVAARIIPFTESPPINTDQLFDTLIVFLDTSASQSPFLEQTKQRLSTLLPKLKIKNLLLYAFDQNVRKIGEMEKNISPEKVLEVLQTEQGLGASDLEAVVTTLKNTELKQARVLFISDMVTTAGESSAITLATKLHAIPWIDRVDVLIPSYHNDRNFAFTIARSGHNTGTVMPLKLDDDSILYKLMSSVYNDVPIKVPDSTWFWPEKINALQPNEPVIIFAELEKDKPFSIKIKGKALPVVIKQTEPVLLKREWARARVDKLLTMEDATRDNDLKSAYHNEVINLSIRERVLSPYTAMLVLETEEDYARYQIDRKSLADILTIGIDGINVIKRAGKENTMIVPVFTPTPIEEDEEELEDSKEDSDKGDQSSDESKPKEGNISMTGDSAGFSNSLDSTNNFNGNSTNGADKSLPPPAPRSAPARNLPTPEPTKPAMSMEESESTVEKRMVDEPPILASPREESTSQPAATTPAMVEREAIVPSDELGTEITDSDGVSLEERQTLPQEEQEKKFPWIGRYAEFRTLLDKNNVKEAGKLAKTWRGENLADVMALIALGEWYQKSGNRMMAARAYGSLIDYFPGRADIRRWSAERLMASNLEHDLTIDILKYAVSQRPDHPSGHYLLAIAYWEAKHYREAIETLQAAKQMDFPRFAQVNRIFEETLALMLTWLQAEKKLATVFPKQQFEWTEVTRPQLRLLLMWETDANDVDFHIYDNQNNHAFYSNTNLPTGGDLYADITTGYGPECFAIDEPKAFPYTLQAHYYNMGPMGYGMGIVHKLHYRVKEGLESKFIPFVVMQEGAFVELGSVKELN